MQKTFHLTRVAMLSAIACGVLACGKAPFSLSESDPSTLHISPSGSTIEAGNSLQLHVFVEEGSDRDLAPADVAWSSSAPNTVAVTSGGVAIGLAAGQADITAEFGGFRAVSSIVVAESPRNCAPGLVPIQC